MELQLANKLQHHIADLLWKAPDKNTVKAIISIYGVDAHIVFNMMMAAYYDEVDAVDIAGPELERIKNL
jgi:hypothetical protein